MSISSQLKEAQRMLAEETQRYEEYAARMQEAEKNMSYLTGLINGLRGSPTTTWENPLFQCHKMPPKSSANTWGNPSYQHRECSQAEEIPSITHAIAQPQIDFKTLKEDINQILTQSETKSIRLSMLGNKLKSHNIPKGKLSEILKEKDFAEIFRVHLSTDKDSIIKKGEDYIQLISTSTVE